MQRSCSCYWHLQFCLLSFLTSELNHHRVQQTPVRCMMTRTGMWFCDVNEKRKCNRPLGHTHYKGECGSRTAQLSPQPKHRRQLTVKTSEEKKIWKISSKFKIATSGSASYNSSSGGGGDGINRVEKTAEDIVMWWYSHARIVQVCCVFVRSSCALLLLLFC